MASTVSYENLQRMALAIFMIAEEEYKLLGLLFLIYAFRQPERIKRGPYNAARAKDVLSHILYTSSDKFYKAHMRYDPSLSYVAVN